MKVESTFQFQEKILPYPKMAQRQLLLLRKLTLKTAEELGLDELEETIKWGEPSYIAKKGSTLRLDWKEKAPDQIAMYFKCTSKLVESFKAIFGDTFQYENNRAIIFKLDEKIPTDELKKCIAATLQYHKVKALPFLGL